MNYSTPNIPDWIISIGHPLYRNIFSYKLGNRNLWGTESLLGDWGGRFLLIAKDFYPSVYIEEAIARGESMPYRHSPTAPTNRNLIKTLRHFGYPATGRSNLDCGFLYTSACFLLRADRQIRGELPDYEQVMKLSLPVLQFTLDNMPNVTCAVAMGSDASRSIRSSGLAAEMKRRNIELHHVSHPSRAMTDTARFDEWRHILG